MKSPTNRIQKYYPDDEEEEVQKINDMLGEAQLKIMDLESYQRNEEVLQALASKLLERFEQQHVFCQMTLFHRVLMEQYCWSFAQSCNNQ
jgi:hypothetical protein